MVSCDPGSGSRMIDTDCRCHLLIEDYEVQSNQYGVSVKVVCSVLVSTDSAQAGKKHTEFFECSGNAVDKFYNLAEAVEIITAAQRKDAADRNVGLDVDETLLKGRQFCADVKMEPNMRKNAATGQRELNPEKPGPYPRIGFNSYSVTSKRAEDVPKDPQFIALLSKQAAAPQQPAPQAQPQQPQQAPPATAGDSMTW